MSSEIKEIWLPQQIKTILNINSLEVVDFSEIKCVQTLEEDLLDSKHIGLNLIKTLDTFLACLTSSNRIYTFYLCDISHVKFLKSFLNNEKLTFYTINGAEVGEIIQSLLQIVLGDLENMVDLIAFDLHMRLDEKRSKERDCLFTIDKVYQRGLRQLSIKELYLSWLNTNIPDIDCTDEELLALNRKPFNTYAKNAIRKQCCLLRILGLTMHNKFLENTRSISRDIYSFGVRAPDSLRENYMREGDGSFIDLCQHLSLCTDDNSMC